MRNRPAKPEKNSGIKMTIPARTRSPLEAFRMFEAGQNIDLVAGYYEREGYVEPDFYMLDHIGKLKELNKYRDMKKEKEKELDDFRQSYIKTLDDQKKALFEKEIEARIEAEVKKRLSNNQNPLQNE